MFLKFYLIIFLSFHTENVLRKQPRVISRVDFFQCALRIGPFVFVSIKRKHEYTLALCLAWVVFSSVTNKSIFPLFSKLQLFVLLMVSFINIQTIFIVNKRFLSFVHIHLSSSFNLNALILNSTNYTFSTLMEYELTHFMAPRERSD